MQVLFCVLCFAEQRRQHAIDPGVDAAFHRGCTRFRIHQAPKIPHANVGAGFARDDSRSSEQVEGVEDGSQEMACGSAKDLLLLQESEGKSAEGDGARQQGVAIVAIHGLQQRNVDAQGPPLEAARFFQPPHRGIASLGAVTMQSGDGEKGVAQKRRSKGSDHDRVPPHLHQRGLVAHGVAGLGEEVVEQFEAQGALGMWRPSRRRRRPRA